MNRCFNIHLWLNYEAFLCQTTRARKIHEYPAQLSILSCMCYFLHSSPIPVKQVLYFFTHKVTKCVGAEVLGKVTFLGVLENVLPTMTPEILWKTERDWERERERERDRQTAGIKICCWQILKEDSVWPHSVCFTFLLFSPHPDFPALEIILAGLQFL